MNEFGIMPCPFCGDPDAEIDAAGIPAIGQLDPYTDYTEDVWVQCQNDNCGCSSAIVNTAEEAIRIWNRRQGK